MLAEPGLSWCSPQLLPCLHQHLDVNGTRRPAALVQPAPLQRFGVCLLEAWQAQSGIPLPKLEQLFCGKRHVPRGTPKSGQ
jgi:hypothetical protein